MRMGRRRVGKPDPRTAGRARVGRPAGTGGPQVFGAAVHAALRHPETTKMATGRAETSRCCLTPPPTGGQSPFPPERRRRKGTVPQRHHRLLQQRAACHWGQSSKQSLMPRGGSRKRWRSHRLPPLPARARALALSQSGNVNGITTRHLADEGVRAPTTNLRGSWACPGGTRGSNEDRTMSGWETRPTNGSNSAGSASRPSGLLRRRAWSSAPTGVSRVLKAV